MSGRPLLRRRAGRRQRHGRLLPARRRVEPDEFLRDRPERLRHLAAAAVRDPDPVARGRDVDGRGAGGEHVDGLAGPVDPQQRPRLRVHRPGIAVVDGHHGRRATGVDPALDPARARVEGDELPGPGRGRLRGLVAREQDRTGRHGQERTAGDQQRAGAAPAPPRGRRPLRLGRVE